MIGAGRLNSNEVHAHTKLLREDDSYPYVHPRDEHRVRDSAVSGQFGKVRNDQSVNTFLLAGRIDLAKLEIFISLVLAKSSCSGVRDLTSNA